jgi:hypothetical protein
VNAVFLAWTRGDRKPVVWNGTDWIESPTEKTHPVRGKKFIFADAVEKLNAMRCRFQTLDEIIVLPLATVQDVQQMAEKRPTKRTRRKIR